jgi:hypothetical protein
VAPDGGRSLFRARSRGRVPDGERFPCLTFLFMDPLGRDHSLAAELDVEEAEPHRVPVLWSREEGAVVAAIGTGRVEGRSGRQGVIGNCSLVPRATAS